MDAVTQALQARTNPAPQGAPNVGTPEVIPADASPGDGEIVEPDATGPVAQTTGQPDTEAGTTTHRGDAPPDPAPKQRRTRKPKEADASAAAPPPTDTLDEPADPYESAMYGPGAP